MNLKSSALKRYADRLIQKNRISAMRKQNRYYNHSKSPQPSALSNKNYTNNKQHNHSQNINANYSNNNHNYQNTHKQMRTVPSDQDTISHQQKQVSNKYYDSRMHLHSFHTVILPKLEQQIAIQEKKTLNQIYKHKNFSGNSIIKKKYQLMPFKKLQPIRLMKRSSSSSSYLSMSSSGRKLTDQYFSQINNIRLVQKLLLVRPTKQNSKSQHQQFYKKQSRYKKNIQLSKSVPFKNKKNGNLNKYSQNKPWLNI